MEYEVASDRFTVKCTRVTTIKVLEASYFSAILKRRVPGYCPHHAANS